MFKVKILPCGRSYKDKYLCYKDKYLCCRRKRKWYNTYWVLRKYKDTFIWEKRCLFCGHTIQLSGHPFDKIF